MTLKRLKSESTAKAKLLQCPYGADIAEEVGRCNELVFDRYVYEACDQLVKKKKKV